MKPVWAVIVHTLRDSVRRKVWIPGAVAACLCVFLIVIQYGFTIQRTAATPYADNIISSFFFFWVWGTLLATLSLGATSLPVERRTQTLLTLPIARWQLVAGKVIGLQVLSAALLVVGYALAAGIAMRQGLPITAYSRFGFVTALTASFACLCVSIPLGAWLSPMASGTTSVILLMLASSLQKLVDLHMVEDSWLVRWIGILMPWRIPAVPMDYAFFDYLKYPRFSIDYSLLGWNAFISLAFLAVLILWMRKSELRIPS